MTLKHRLEGEFGVHLVSSLNPVPDPEVPAKARTRTWSAAHKARILAEYESLDRAGKGALLRREGIYSSLVAAWRAQRDLGARVALARPAGRAAPPLSPGGAAVSTTVAGYSMRRAPTVRAQYGKIGGKSPLKDHTLKQAVIDHLTAIVHETRPVPEYRTLRQVFPAQASLFYIDLDSFRMNKLAAGRDKDLEDLRRLREI